MKNPLATPAVVLGVVAIAFALLSVTPTFIGLLLTPLALILSLGAVALGHVSFARSTSPTKTALILSYVALAVTVGFFMYRTFAATMAVM